MTNSSCAPLSVLELRRLRDRTALLPPGPWVAIELSHLELHGPAAFDPDIDLSERAWRANEHERAATAAWRGLVAADGTQIVGQRLAGGRPQQVHQPELLWLAEVRTVVPRLLATLRGLWPGAAPPVVGPGATAASRPVSRVELEVAARAAYEHDPGVERWGQLSDRERCGWVERIAVALAKLEEPGP